MCFSLLSLLPPALSAFLFLLYLSVHQQDDPGPTQGLFLLKEGFPCRCCRFGGQILAFGTSSETITDDIWVELK